MAWTNPRSTIAEVTPTLQACKFNVRFACENNQSAIAKAAGRFHLAAFQKAWDVAHVFNLLSPIEKPARRTSFDVARLARFRGFICRKLSDNRNPKR